jgi:hypothetical protein
MMVGVERAEYVEGFTIRVVFQDGRTGDIDLREIVQKDPRPIFAELSNWDRFKDFKVDYDTICWANGLDLAPEYLYFLAFRDDPALKRQFQEWGYLS